MEVGAKFNQLDLTKMFFDKFTNFSIEQIKYFLKAGLDVNEVDKYGRNTLHLAAYNN
jgi:ankyrin repeat protein